MKNVKSNSSPSKSGITLETFRLFFKKAFDIYIPRGAYLQQQSYVSTSMEMRPIEPKMGEKVSSLLKASSGRVPVMQWRDTS